VAFDEFWGFVEGHKGQSEWGFGGVEQIVHSFSFTQLHCKIQPEIHQVMVRAVLHCTKVYQGCGQPGIAVKALLKKGQVG